MSSWQVRLAAALVGVGAVLGVGLVVLAFAMLGNDPGFLFAILPVLFGVLLIVGLNVAMFSSFLALRLLRRRPGARLQTAVLGGCLGFSGLSTMAFSPGVGLLLLGYGALLMLLMATDAAARDLGPWLQHLKRTAPWGAKPGRGLWKDEAPQQGPWAPDPTTLPWLSWKNHSGPQAPWWQTWQAGLSQGIPLGELIVLGLCLLLFAFSLVAILVPGLRAVGLLALLPSLGGVVLVEQRMRVRLSGRS